MTAHNTTNPIRSFLVRMGLIAPASVVSPTPVDITKLLPRKKEVTALSYGLKNGELLATRTELEKKKGRIKQMMFRNIKKGKLQAFEKHQIWYCYEMTRIQNTIEVAHLYTGQHICTLNGVDMAQGA